MRYSLYGQMAPGQMLPWQMLPWQLKSIQYGPRNLPFKFGQNRASNSWDIADIEFSVVGGGGVPSHIYVKPKLRLRLGWVEVGLGFWQYCVSTGCLVKTCWVRRGWVKTDWVKTGWVKTGCVMTGWVMTGWVETGLIRTDQVMTAWFRTGPVRIFFSANFLGLGLGLELYLTLTTYL